MARRKIDTSDWTEEEIAKGFAVRKPDGKLVYLYADGTKSYGAPRDVVQPDKVWDDEDKITKVDKEKSISDFIYNNSRYSEGYYNEKEFEDLVEKLDISRNELKEALEKESEDYNEFQKDFRIEPELNKALDEYKGTNWKDWINELFDRDKIPSEIAIDWNKITGEIMDEIDYENEDLPAIADKYLKKNGITEENGYDTEYISKLRDGIIESMHVSSYNEDEIKDLGVTDEDLKAAEEYSKTVNRQPWNDKEYTEDEKTEKSSYNEDVQSLADELNLDYEDIEQDDGNYFKTSEGAEYVIYDEEEADNAARESIENSIDEMGIEAFSENFQNWILENALDKDFFEEAMEESNDYYASDITSESDSVYGNRLIQEAYDAGVLSDDDFEVNEDGEILYDTPTKDIYDIHDEYVEYLNNREDDPIEWYKFNYGENDLSDLIKDNRIKLDTDAIVEECIKWDGRGHFISQYDGEEIELKNGKYAYRIN